MRGNSSKLVSLLDKGRPPWEESIVQWATENGAYSLYEVNTQWDYELEGYFLAHCLGTKKAAEFNVAHKVLSLRDKLGYPHATVLLNRLGKYSPYGASRDLLTDEPVKLDDPSAKFPVAYRVLQVRGREDRIARWEYYALIRGWYTQHGGLFKDKEKPLGLVKRAVIHAQDRDIKYHYGYILDESANWFNWAYWNAPESARMRELGLVKL